jgi:FG-GAP-like repeat/Bacterial Ig-like domain (group 2)/FG-GAP repeat
MSRRFFVPSAWIFAMALCGSWILVSCGGSANRPGGVTLQSISVSPQNSAVSVGQTQQFTATGKYSDGSTQSLTSVTWSSNTATVGTISSSGLAMGVAAGTTTIGASSGGISGSTMLTVNATLTYLLAATRGSGGTHPKGVVIADFNGDGKLDIAVSNFDQNAVAVFLNDGSGNFGAPIITTVQITNGLGPLAVGDFNEDGKADLVVATISGPQASIVLLGHGDGTFSQQPPIPNSFGFFHAKVVDLNGDHHEDLVFAGNGNISVSLGKGDGTFAATTSLPSGSFPGTYLGLAVADFNGDGKLDIAASDSGSPTAGVGKLVFYVGNGDGTFANATVVDLIATFPGSLASGDFNSDGKQDVLVGFPNNALIGFGKGDGTFDLVNLEFVYSTNVTTTNGGVTVLASDLTKNGKADAVTADFNIGTLQITLNGALGKAPPSNGIFSFALAPGLADIAVGDLNGDGIQDVVVTNYQTGEITIVLSKKQ